MKNYKLIPILIILILTLNQTLSISHQPKNPSKKQFKYTEKLNIEPLKDQSKNLYNFDFNFQIPIDFSDIDSEIYTFSRSVLENIFVSANSTFSRVEAACGTVNPVFRDDEKIDNDYFFPQNGMKLFADSFSNYQVLLESLGEMFKLTKNNVRGQNNFLVENSLKDNNVSQKKLFEGDFWFAQDPTDFICTNNIEHLKKYFPCGGLKGLISIIDQTLLFKADYTSIQGDLNYDRKNKIANIQITINAIMPKKNIENYFLLNNIQSCPLVTETFINFRGKQPQQIEKLQNFDLQQQVLNFTQNNEIYESINFKHTPLIKSERYMGDRWFDFKGNFVHEIYNNDKKRSVKIITTEYLIWQFQPVLHKMQMIKSGKNYEKEIPKSEIQYTLDITEDESYKFQFFFELNPGESAKIIIPMNKLMKSFENYPHDPQRGHDLISGSLLYQFSGEKRIEQLQTKNILIRLPEPDFSMPFNIMTYVCVLLGYVFLTIYLNSATKPK